VRERLGRIAFGAALAASLAAGLALPAKEAKHVWDHPLFFAAYGLLGCLALIGGAKALGKGLLQRREDYYPEDREAQASAPAQAPAAEGVREESADVR